MPFNATSCLPRTLRLGGCGLLLFAAGCLGSQQSQDATASSGEPPAVSAEEATPRETINQTTQNVLSLEEALASGGEEVDPGITSTNPLLQSAEAYRTSVAKVGALAVQQAIQIRNAQSIADPKPLTHAEFLREIIKPGQPGGIELARLPYYQEYAWDEADQQLVVVNFPARIEEREQQR